MAKARHGSGPSLMKRDRWWNSIYGEAPPDGSAQVKRQRNTSDDVIIAAEGIEAGEVQVTTVGLARWADVQKAHRADPSTDSYYGWRASDFDEDSSAA